MPADLQNLPNLSERKLVEGLTLFELLIVLVILGALCTLAFFYFHHHYFESQLDFEARKIVSFLKLARSKSITLENGAIWGVKFDQDEKGQFYQVISSLGDALSKNYIPAELSFKDLNFPSIIWFFFSEIPVSGFHFRKPILIDNSSNSNDLLNYQILIILDTQSLISQMKMNPDCSDLRFYDDKGNSLSYWIESGCNSQNTRIWVKVPKIPKNSSITIYLYYGNPSAPDKSNGPDTFIAFDLKFDGPFGGRISVGGSNHNCGLLSDGTAKCWGDNVVGQLGDGTTTDKLTPVSVSDLSNAVAISAGGSHTCALLQDGSVKCWGYNYYGQLGDGTTTDRYTPISVSGLSNAVAISTGAYHTCALVQDGTAKCWGWNNFGQLGDGTTTDRHTPVSVSGLSNAVAISAGGSHTCALLQDGSVKCWGRNNFGQLGDGTTTDRHTPVSVSGLSNAVAISAGGIHTCALLQDGSVKCWGDNGYGQLGDGTTTDRLTPVSVSDLSNAVAVSAGEYHTCGLLSDGSVKCWGWNYYGQLGDGTTTDRYTPVSVSDLSNAVAISTGYYYTCALLQDGSAKCWGYNADGQLGDGTTTDRSTPVSVSQFSFGGRYDKSGGIPSSIQKPPFFTDTYFVREYSFPEPLVILKNEEELIPTGISFVKIASKITDRGRIIFVNKEGRITLEKIAKFGFSYRRAVIIDNRNNSHNLEDWAILINLDTSSLIGQDKMRLDCGDIRFYDSDEASKLNYYLESGCNTDSTKLWVKVPQIPKNSTKTIYLYYGDPTLTSESNPRSVFVFYDDAESTRGWTRSGYWDQKDCFKYEGDYSWGYSDSSCTHYNTSSNMGELISPSFNLPLGTNLVYYDKSETEYWDFTENPYYDKEYIYLSLDDGVSWSQISLYSGTWSWTKRTIDISNSSSTAGRLKFSFDTVDGLFNDFSGWYIDHLYIRKVTSPEPTITLEKEETL